MVRQKTLVSNGVGNVSWQNLTIPLPEGYGNIPLPNLSTVPDFYLPNNKSANTHWLFAAERSTMNKSANRFQFFYPNVSNTQPWQFWFSFRNGGENDAQTMLSWVKQVSYFEKWFRGNNEVMQIQYKIIILDKSKWTLGNSNKRVQIDSDYVEMESVSIINGKGDEDPTCMLVPFK